MRGRRRVNSTIWQFDDAAMKELKNEGMKE
jgi:hypothetical protein